MVKPFDDLAGLVNRLREHAIASKSNNVQHQYVDQMRKRHASVLERYRALK